MATTIPSKGGMGRFAVDKSLEFIAECGDGERDIIVKSDQEASANYLVKEVVERRVENKTQKWQKDVLGRALGSTPGALGVLMSSVYYHKKGCLYMSEHPLCRC